jgi:hypothetical protein
MELIKYRDIGMASYTYFWKEQDRIVSPFFDDEIAAMVWANKDKPEPKVLDDARAEDEEFERIQKQNS